MPSTLAKSRITKKLLPGQAGAKKLSERYGATLVCVRYRQDPACGRRYTTVELVVDEGPIAQDTHLPAVVYIRLQPHEKELWQAMLKEGAQWDRAQRAWKLEKAAVQRLQIVQRAIKNLPSIDIKNGKK